MNILQCDKKEFSLKKTFGGAHINLPFTEVQLQLDKNEFEDFNQEAERALKAAIANSHYCLQRFIAVYEYLASNIKSLREANFIDNNGFTSEVFNDRNRFRPEAERFLENLSFLSHSNKALRDTTDKLPSKCEVNAAIDNWPSIQRATMLPSFEKSTYEPKSKAKVKIASANTLVGLSRPLIFHNGTMEITTNNNKIRLIICEKDTSSLIGSLLGPKQLDLMYLGKKAWEALDAIESLASATSKQFFLHKFDIDNGHFVDGETDLKGIFHAIIELEKKLETEEFALKSQDE